jgi:hypothetical protein
MWIRAAFWVGTVKAGSELRFQRGIDEDLILSLKALPGVRDAKALWPRQFEDGPPAIACQILVEFGERADLDRMLGSAERRALRARVGELVALFNGELSHINYEVN